MNFKINALSPEPFQRMFNSSDAELSDNNIVKQVVTEAGSTPCRVCFKDANIGDMVLLLNYQHMAEATPFKASHAIYVTEAAKQAFPQINTVPEMIHSRMISLRAFDQQHMMVEADLAQGLQVAEKISQMLDDQSVDYVDLHFAKQGCFVGKATSC